MIGRARRAALTGEADSLMRAHPDRSVASTREPPLAVIVDPRGARFSTGTRCSALERGRRSPGTFRDAEERLGYIADMGFDVVYLPPITR